MKSCISGVGLILCLAVGAAAQRNSTADQSRRGAPQRDAFDTAFNATAAQMEYDLLHENELSPIQSSALLDLNTNQRTTVSVKELQHKILGSALKEDSRGIKAIKKGDYQTALGHFQKAADIDPKFADAVSDLGPLLRDWRNSVRSITVQEDLREAQKSYSKEIKSDPVPQLS